MLQQLCLVRTGYLLHDLMGRLVALLKQLLAGLTTLLKTYVSHFVCFAFEHLRCYRCSRYINIQVGKRHSQLIVVFHFSSIQNSLSQAYLTYCFPLLSNSMVDLQVILYKASKVVLARQNRVAEEISSQSMMFTADSSSRYYDKKKLRGAFLHFLIYMYEFSM